MAKLSQVKLLLWKNWLITKRKWILTIGEILLPCFFMILLMGIRTIVKADKYDNITTWPTCDISDFVNGSQLVGFAPNNSFTRKIMNKISQNHQINIEGFETEKDMVEFSLKSNVPSDYIGGVIFITNSSTASSEWTFKIRLKATSDNKSEFLKPETWRTDQMFPIYQLQGPRNKDKPCGGDPDYYQRGFYTLQFALTRSLLEILQSQSISFFNRTKWVLQRHPYPPFSDDGMTTVLQNQFPFILILSFELIALNIVKDIVEEKEKRLKEAMKMMGMSNWVHWLAWFVKFFCFMFVSICLMTLLLCVPVGQKGRVIASSNPAIILLFFVIYSLATISLCFLLSTLFSKANSGAAAAGVIFFAMYIPYLFISPRYESMSLKIKASTCILSNIALSYGGQVLGMLEGQGVGIQWHNIAHGSSIDDPFTMLHIMLMLLFDAVLYAILTWYIEAVFPGQYGIPLPWYFPFTESYWRGTTPVQYSEDILPGVEQNDEFFEKEPVNLKPGIQINCLRKEFFGGKKIAVAGITLNMYEGQITALLGHNGAGKTTTISMLTGLFPPTSGTAFVNGFNICRDMASVRDSLGICPQHDVLFEKLTVEEHLQFFAVLKGFPREGMEAECEKMLESIALKEKRDNLSGELSGGMKRKLSLGMALIGGSKIVILDEPSSGLDPNARRQIWSVIENNRAGRTMLLTTHFMDEADCLGDRIAIMSEGLLRCCGSTLFLKSKYGAGYHLVMVKTPQCDVLTVDEFIKSYIPQAKIESNVGTELSYLLPHDSSAEFPKLFTSIETKQEEIGISSYGITVTTMEEVFLRVSENPSAEKIQPEPSNDSSTASTPVSHHSTTFLNPYTSRLSLNRVVPIPFHRNYLNSGFKLNIQQFMALLAKKALYSWRNKLLTLGQISVPLLFTILSAIVVKTFPAHDIFPPLVLEPTMYGINFIPYSFPQHSTNETLEIIEIYSSQFLGSATIFDDISRLSDYKTDPNMLKYLGDVGTRDLPLYNEYYQVAADFGYLMKNQYISFFNDQSFHSGAISLSTMASAILKYFNGDNSSLVFINHPLPKSDSEKVDDQSKGNATSFTVSIVLIFGISFLASSFSIPLIKEQATKAKHVQYVSGVTSFNYWMATYIWDIPIALIPCILILAVFKGFSIEGYYGDEHSAHLFILFLMYVLSVLPMTYLASFLFTIPSSGLVWLTLFNMLAGVATMLVVMILKIPSVKLDNISKLLTWVFMGIFPQFCLGQGLSDYSSNYVAITACKKVFPVCKMIPKNNSLIRCCPDRCGDNCLPLNEDYLGWRANGIGRMLIFMAVQTVFYFSIVLLIESTFMRRVLYHLTNYIRKKTVSGEDNKGASDEILTIDEDVQSEQFRIATGDIQQLIETNLLVISNVSKQYGNFTAVDHIGVGIPRGECFGLLGINGAGKTTTFKMLTGDEMISSGKIYVDGLNVKNNMRKIQRQIGYCPQFDALIESMTAREVLTMFAHFRGVHLRQIKQTVDELLDKLMLEKYADKTVVTYSGGNKRKLSTAVALVGNPPLVLLDEPTTGMDPGTRRKLWNTLIGVRDSGRTLILTSHSMDECEALCTRIAIMVNGQFRCLGSTQHLKSKFGEGYSLVAKMHIPENSNTKLDINPLMRHIEEKFPGCVLKDVHEGIVDYQIRKDTLISWAELFGTFEQIKETYNLETYSLGQTSLEQVFINFARSQQPAKEMESKSWKTCCRCK